MAEIGWLVFLGVLAILGFVIFNTLGFFTGAPYAATPATKVQEILTKLKLKRGQVVFDLGAGDGVVLREALRFEVKRIVGIELNPLLFWFLKIRFRKDKAVNIIWGDLRRINLSSADIVFVFLLPETVKSLEKKFNKELKKGALVITYLASLKDRKIFKRVGSDFNVYQF